MRRTLVGGLVLAAVFTALTSMTVAQNGVKPAPGYQRVLPWGPVPENPSVFWEMGRVAVNTKGNRLYAFRRSDPPILQIDPATGKILKEWGAGMFVWPHGM